MPVAHEPAQEDDSDYDLEQVAEALADGRAYRQPHVVVHEQIPDDHGRPQAQPHQVQGGDAHSDRKPHDRRDRAGEPERVAEVRRGVVGGDEEQRLGAVGTPEVPALD